MTEEAIVASLKKNIPKEPLLQKPDEPSKIVQEVTESVETVQKPNSYPNDVAAMKLLDFFEVEPGLRKDRTLLDQLNYIYAWGTEEAKSEDSVDVMGKIRELEQRLGLVFKSKQKLHSIYRWIKLDKQRRLVEKEMALV